MLGLCKLMQVYASYACYAAGYVLLCRLCLGYAAKCAWVSLDAGYADIKLMY